MILTMAGISLSAIVIGYKNCRLYTMMRVIRPETTRMIVVII